MDVEQEILCAPNEVEKIKKLVATHESTNQVLQVELVTSNQIIENKKKLLAEKE